MLMTAEQAHVAFVQHLHCKYIRARKAFRALDHNFQHHIDTPKLRWYLKKHNILLNSNEFAALIRRYDLNGDGLIDYKEFCYLFRR